MLREVCNLMRIELHGLKNMIRRMLTAVLGLSAMCWSDRVWADVTLPAVFSDHMVLQQQIPLRIWGWAEAGEMVTVSIGANQETVTTAESGRWEVKLPAMTASKTPTSIKVQGKNSVEISDVLVGEVWLCSGQSNMEWPVAACVNAQEEIAAAQYPLIRHIKVPLVPSTVPLNNFQSAWQVCSPETAGSFTACGYFMARKLQKELDVPVGLINSSWGGTRVEPWTPPVGFQRVDALQNIYQSVVGRTPGTPEYRSRLESHTKSLEEWTAKARAALTSNVGIEPSPAFPAELAPFTSNQDPTMLYNGMIHSLVGFPLRGAIWYQGESNHGEGMLYLEKKKALIGGWRELWGQGDFPFYYVQIAPYRYGNEDPTILAKFWEAQAAVQTIPQTGMVVINDIATLNDIHPPNKQDVGLRLAQLALKNDYGKTDVVANSPEFDGLEIQKDRLTVKFRNSAGGLKTRDGKPVTHFEVVGVGSNGFQPATAVIEGDSVVLSSDKVTTPVAFRFAWHMLAEPNLCGGTGLPVGAVRGGDVPDFLSSLPVAKEYTLVYDLDLNNLSHQIRYDVDRSDKIKSFDRIGYLVELTAAGGEEKQVFVSMEAFTQDVHQIGIPTIASKARFQQTVKSMDVFSNFSGITSGTGITTGNIEFWPDNYGVINGTNVVGASNDVYDFGDETAPPADGYGSMQVHNYGAKQTLFALNHWVSGAGADLGIGNGPDRTPDWTFSGNAGSYSSKRLRIYVRETK